MKKILLIIAFLFAGITAFSQSGVPEPTHTLTPSKFKPGNWHMVGTWDSTNACYADTLGYYMEGDTVKIWSNKILWINGNTIQPNLWKLTGNKLEPVISTNYVNTDSSYYIKGIDFIRYYGDPYYSLGIGDASMTNDTVSYHNISIGRNSLNRTSTGNNIVSIGNSSLSMNKSGTGNTSIGYQSMYSNTTGSYNVSTGYSCLLSNKTGNNNTSYGYYSNRFTSSGNNNTSIGYYSLANNTTDSNNIAIGYYAGYDATLSNRLWIGQGDSNAAIIYGEMLTRPRIRINGNTYIKNDLQVTGDITADTIIAGYISTTDTPIYSKAAFDDSSRTITGGTNVFVSNGKGSLFTKIATEGLTWSGDTCIISTAGNYSVDFALYGTGGNGADWKIRRANKRGAVITYGVSGAYFSTDGASNYHGGSLHAFIIGAEAGDRVYLTLTRIGGSGDFIARAGRFQIRKVN